MSQQEQKLSVTKKSNSPIWKVELEGILIGYIEWEFSNGQNLFVYSPANDSPLESFDSPSLNEAIRYLANFFSAVE